MGLDKTARVQALSLCLFLGVHSHKPTNPTDIGYTMQQHARDKSYGMNGIAVTPVIFIEEKKEISMLNKDC